MRILHVVGARPNFMKIAPIVREMRQHAMFEQMLVHTGQHYDRNMSEAFFEDLELTAPDVHLEVGSGSHAEQTARVMTAFEPVVVRFQPDWVVVVGDVNSTLAAALVAAKLRVPVAHVEAGLRSFDRSMPEELNRLLTDQIADLLFTTEESANRNLQLEGIAPEKVHFVGNVMIDSLIRSLPGASRSTALTDLDLKRHHYVVVTLHRPSNVDDLATLEEVLRGLSRIAAETPVVFPVHPRTRDRISRLAVDLPAVQLVEPLGYLAFLQLTANAALVITDSGGVQEETTFLGIPCLTLRSSTERPVTVKLGMNRLIPSESKAIAEAAGIVLSGGAPRSRGRPPLWDGHAAERIVGVFRQASAPAA